MKILLTLLIPLMLSCAKEDLVGLSPSSSEYLKNKSITNIRIFNEDIWYISTRICDTCNVPDYSSHIPLINQLSRQRGNEFRFDESRAFTIPVADNKGVLYTSVENEILKINDIRNYTTIVKTGDFKFNQFVFDKNNHIWMSGNQGIAYWDGNKTTFFNTTNSKLGSEITHGIAVDRAGVIWVPMDMGKGLLRIIDRNWEIIPYEKIPGLSTGSYLSNPIVDKENRIWFTIFNPQPPATSNAIYFDGQNWKTEFPDILPHGVLFVDSEGTVWRLNHILDTSSTIKFTLQFLNNDTWKHFDVSDVQHLILSVEADAPYVYLGTTTGLVVKKR